MPIAELALEESATAPSSGGRSSAPPTIRPTGRPSPPRCSIAWHRRPPTQEIAQENTLLGAGDTRKRYLRLTVYNGDDAPLALRSVSPAYVAEEIVFRAPAAGAYTLYVGGDVPAPTYDLAAVLARSGEQPKLTAAFASVTQNPLFGHLAKPPPPPPLSERFKLPIALGLALLLGVLALWTLRLLRRAREKP